MSELLGWGIVLALVSLPGLLFPQAIWALFGGLSYRTPERVEPSPRRYRVARMGSATTLLIGLVIIVGSLWPGTADEKAYAAFYTSLIGIALFIAGVIISIVVRKRRRFASKQYEDEEDLPPDEPSDLSYGFDYFGIVVYLVLLVVVSGSLIGMEQRKQERIDSITGDRPLTEEEQKHVDELFEQWNDLHLDRYPVLADVPEGAVVALSQGYSFVDATEKTPRRVWYQAETEYDVAPPMGIGEADLAIRIPAFTCHVTAIVIQETAETVALGFIVDGENAVPKEGTNVAPCRGGNVISSEIYLVDLPSPLGERDLVTLSGGRMIDLSGRE